MTRILFGLIRTGSASLCTSSSRRNLTTILSAPRIRYGVSCSDTEKEDMKQNVLVPCNLRCNGMLPCFSAFFQWEIMSMTSCLLPLMVKPFQEGSTLTGKNFFVGKQSLSFNPFALRTAKTLRSFGCSECKRVKS